MSQIQTREAWLDSAIDALRPRFADLDAELPEKIHVSVGFGYGGAKAENKIILGQAWKTTVSADGVNQVFVSPTVDDPAVILAILIHELVHVALDMEDGHTGRFRKLALALGLTGKMTETVPGDALSFELFTLGAALGTYPHAAMDMAAMRQPGPDGKPVSTSSGPAKQSTRYRKVSCREHDPMYTLRMTRAQIDRGLPLCGVCHQLMTED